MRRRAACMAKASCSSSWCRSSSGPGTSTAIPGSRESVFDQLEVLADLGGLAEHDRGRAVLLVRQPNRLLDEIALQAAPAHDEVQVDPGEHLRIRGRALGGHLHLAAAHVLAALFQDHDHVVGGAAAGTDEHQLHRPRREVAPAALRRAVHRDDVIASGFGEEGHSFAAPAYGAVHGSPFLSAARAPQGAVFCVKSAAFPHFGYSSMKTNTAKVGEVEQGWFVVDAQGKVLGRLAVQIATRRSGKHKPQYTPHIDTGDYIVVVNASKLRVTGRKTERKTYYRHSGFPGGLKETNFGKLHAAHPERVLQKAVKGMLPKGPLGYAMLRKLKIYAGGTHPHSAQQPKNLEI